MKKKMLNNKDFATLNVKFPFCEAVEILRDEKEYVGMYNPVTNVVIYVDHGELFIKKGNASVNLTVTDVMDADWYVICRVNNRNNNNLDGNPTV